MDDDFRDIEHKAAEGRREQNHADHYDAIAGRFDTGRRINLGLKGKHDHDVREKKERESLLKQALTLNAHYAKLYSKVMDDLNHAEDVVYTALLDAAEAVANTGAALDAALDQATMLPDGTRVFMAKDGSVYSEDGRKLDDDESAAIQWREGRPSWEDFQARKKAHEQAKARLEHLERDNGRLAFIRVRMENADNPPTEGELNGFEAEIEGIEARAKAEHEHRPSSELEAETLDNSRESILALNTYTR